MLSLNTESLILEIYDFESANKTEPWAYSFEPFSVTELPSNTEFIIPPSPVSAEPKSVFLRNIAAPVACGLEYSVSVLASTVEFSLNAESIICEIVPFVKYNMPVSIFEVVDSVRELFRKSTFTIPPETCPSSSIVPIEFVA